MTNTPMITKVRFVRCPKCREILAELPDISVYKCGGCGTILQAKSRKVEMNRAEADSQVKDDVAATGQEGAISSKQDISYPATVLSANENNERPEDSNEFCSPNEEEPTTEDTRKLDDINQYVSRDQTEGEESERAIQKGDNFPVGIQSSPETKDIENDFFPLEKDQTTQYPLAGSSFLEIVSHDASHTIEPSVVNDDTNDVCNSKGQSTETDRKSTNEDPSPAALDKKIALVVSLEKYQMTQNPHSGDCSSVEIVSHDAPENIEPREEVNAGTEDVCKSERPSKKKVPKCIITDPMLAPIALERNITPDDPLPFNNDHLVPYRVSVCSVDTVESSKLFDSNFELGNQHSPGMINSPTTKSYYAQDGSESSYDGTDYRSQQHISHPFRRRIDNRDSTRARVLQNNRFDVNNTVNSDQESNYQRRPELSSSLQERHHHSMDYGNHDEFYSSKLPLHSEEFTSDNRTSYPRAYHHEPLPSVTNFHAHKMELLRSVCELQDQLDQMQLPKLTPHGSIPSTFMNGSSSSRYNRLEPGMEIYTGSHLNPRRAELYNGQRVAFSGESAYHRHHVNSSLSNRYHQHRHHSAQLPSHSTHMSSFSRPQHYSSSEIKRLYLKDKYHTEKRHLRPIAGAAPFLTCHHCFRLLEIPADFLLVEKRCHQVRCNACGLLLKFSLDEKAHLVPILSRNKNKSLIGTVETGLILNERKMRKSRSDIGERTSALHWLMGYESPSQVYDE